MSLKEQARRAIIHRLQRMLPDVAPDMQLVRQHYPHAHGAGSFSRPTGVGTVAVIDSDLPMPPPELWADYCTTSESWLDSGRLDVATMRRLLADTGTPIEAMGRVLEVGSATGRMIRWLEDIAAAGVEVWGVDIWSTATLWCQDNLAPTFRFATTTTIPHLPFPDQHFDLVYGGSLFTHIDDLAEAWFLEMHRVLAPGGRLYFSINDRHAVDLFEGNGNPDDYAAFYERTGGQHAWDAFVAIVQANEDYQRFLRQDAYMFTMGTTMKHVMWDTDVLTQRLAWGFDTQAITPQGYGHQTTVLLAKS
jgi:SAM-dependent methyltransferase